MFNLARKNRELRKKKMQLKAENQELRNEIEEKDLVIWKNQKDIKALQNNVDILIDGFNSINNELKTNQYGSINSFENKIREILANLQKQANIPLN